MGESESRPSRPSAGDEIHNIIRNPNTRSVITILSVLIWAGNIDNVNALPPSETPLNSNYPFRPSASTKTHHQQTTPHEQNLCIHHPVHMTQQLSINYVTRLPVPFLCAPIMTHLGSQNTRIPRLNVSLAFAEHTHTCSRALCSDKRRARATCSEIAVRTLFMNIDLQSLSGQVFRWRVCVTKDCPWRGRIPRIERHKQRRPGRGCV